MLEGEDGELLECLQRQMAEIEALSFTFPEEGALSFASTEADNLSFARRVVEGDGGVFSAADVAEISGLIRLQDVQLHGGTVGLRFVLPKQYPLVPANLSADCCAPRSDHEVLDKSVKECAQESVGGECLLLAVEVLKEAALSLAAASRMSEAERDDAEQRNAKGTSASEKGPSHTIRRSLIWFHHIKSTTKRKFIVETARQLDIRGYSKPGFPGIIVCEGLADDVQDYTSRIRALSWQAMQVRGHEHEIVGRDDISGTSGGEALARLEAEVERARRFQGPFFELGEDGMSELAKICREAGVEELFLTALKISKD